MVAARPKLRASGPSKGHLKVKRLAPPTLEQKYSWEQLRELEKHFKKEPHPDLTAQRVLASRLNLTEKQVKTWFIHRSLKKKMCIHFAWLLWKPVRHNPYSCASNKAGAYSWCGLTPINALERFRLNFQRYRRPTQSYQTHGRRQRQGVYQSEESAWCRMIVLPRTVKPHISHASYQGAVKSDKESSQNIPGLPETLEALKELRLSSGYENTDDF